MGSNTIWFPHCFSGNGCRHGSAYLYPMTSLPLVCQPNFAASCPEGYDCEFSTSNQQYQCCSGVIARSGVSVSNINEHEKKIKVSVGQPHQPLAPLRPVYPPQFSIPNPVVPHQPHQPACNPRESTVPCKIFSNWNIPTVKIHFSGRSLGQDCCADEQCTYGCKLHHSRKICMCASHMILDMTGKPYKCCKTKFLTTEIKMWPRFL